MSNLIRSKVGGHHQGGWRQKGFTLVEIMVGMVIALLGIVIMMQIFALTEGQKRSTTGAGNAQGVGAIAMYGLQRDLKQSGYGITNMNLLGCDVLLRAGLTLTSIAPVTINHALIPAGDPNTDTLLVVYGNSGASPEGELITDAASDITPPYSVAVPGLFATNDRVIAAPSSRLTPCSLILDTVTNVSATQVSVSTGVGGMGQGTLFNLGKDRITSPTATETVKVIAYAVHRGNLTACDLMDSTVNCLAACSLADGPTSTTVGGSCNSAWTPVGNNIVSLRAEYGRDTTSPADGVLDTYDQTTPTTACGWSGVVALRFALVARNDQFDKTVVTAAAPTWAGSSSATPVPITLSNDANWQNYRYKLFQTTVPLRNASWFGAQTGC